MENTKTVSIKKQNKSAASSLMKKNIRKFMRNKLAVLGLVIVVAMTVASIMKVGPGTNGHILGTDTIGRDLFARVLFGGCYSIFIGVFSSIMSGIIGAVLGAVAGYFGGRADKFLVRVSELFQTFPQLVLVMMLVAISGTRGMANIIMIFTFTGWMTTFRMVRNEFMSIKSETYVKVCEAFGMGRINIMFKQILPNVMTPIIVSTTTNVAVYILQEATLSFIGLGISDQTPTWGNILNAAKSVAVVTNQTAVRRNFMDNQKIILNVENLNTTFISDKKEIKIVKNVSFQVKRGKALAVVGESGCGKSVTMNSIMRFLGKNAIVKADNIQYNALHDGKVTEYHLESITKPNGSEMRSLRGPDLAMVFQDPMSSLNPVYKVGDQVAEGLLQHNKGMKKAEAREKVLEMFRKLGIPDPEERIDCYPHQFSGGMKQRVVIAIAMICNPELIICDEPTTALDVTIQAQIMELLKSLQVNEGKSIILITHNMGLVAEMADEVCVMYMGRVVEFGSLEDIFDHTSHPYPNPVDLKEGCEFADRCSECMEKCRRGKIPMFEVSIGHKVRCLKYDSYPEVK